MNKKGFTIVELLIVIVVIAILAAISVVAYNGIQIRAENSKTQQGIAQYAKAILAYSAANNAYPTDSGYPCLGSQSACAKRSGSGTCTNNPDGGGTGISTSFDTQIQQFSSIPPLSTQTVNCSSNTYSGAYYRGTTGKDAGLVFYLKGDQPCNVSGMTIVNKVQQEDMTRCGTAFATLP